MSAVAPRVDFRPEIEGLRVLAAGLVAVCHIWLGGVSGGVDVFFIVSGFLITRSLLSQRRGGGRIRPLAFWANLLKRLLPAAYLVIAAICLAGLTLLPVFVWVNTVRHAVASMLYVENWLLAFDAVNYLQQALDTTTPFRHYWALSLQGQFYLLWPLLCLLLLRGMPVEPGDGNARRRLTLAFAALFSVSLAYSVITTADNQQFAYYDSFARVWEFTLGALLGLWIGWLRLPPRASLVAGWAGLAGLLTCALVLDISDQFPGYVALLPTLSAAAIIIAGGTPVRGGAPRLLGARPLVALGGLSYAFYLWHWPLYVVYRQLTRQPEVTLGQGLVIIAVALLLSWATTRWAENPIRFSSLGRQRPLATFVVLALLSSPVVALVGAWGLYTKSLTSVVAPLDLSDPRYPGARVRLPEVGLPPPAPLYPKPINVHRDLPVPYTNGCHQTHREAALLSCRFGDTDSERVIAIVGGSHSLQWLPAFRVFAAQAGFAVVNYTKSYCLFASEAGFGTVYPYPSCTEWNQALLRRLLAREPALVFTTYSRDGGPNEYIPEAFLARFRQLGDHGIPVLAMRDNPWYPFEPSKCVALNGLGAAECLVPRDKLLARSDPARRLANKPENVRFVDFSRFFCNRRVCFPALGNVLLYRDSHHLSTAYVRTLAAFLHDEVRATLKQKSAAVANHRGAGKQEPSG